MARSGPARLTRAAGDARAAAEQESGAIAGGVLSGADADYDDDDDFPLLLRKI